MANKTFILLLIFTLHNSFLFAQQYHRKDICGIWMLEYNEKSDETPEIFRNEYYVFNEMKMLTISTHSSKCIYCKNMRKIGVHKYGFTDKIGIINDSIMNIGNHLAIQGNYCYDVLDWFYIEPKNYLELRYNQCLYLERFPKKAQLVLFQESMKDSINYAREFLEYDICATTIPCELLDSTQNSTNFVIAKDEIVTVRNVEGDLLQVEYEDEQEHFVTGYIRRENLQFVVEKEDIDK